MLNSNRTSLVPVRHRRLTVTTLVTFCVLAGGLVFASAPASALVRHEYLSELTGFSKPAGVAVDSNSDVYVIDEGFGSPVTVDRFGASGAPLPFSASELYVEGSKLTGTPTGPGETVVPFEGQRNEGNSPLLAVDDANGDLYVVSGAIVDVFSETGKYLFQLTEAPPSAPNPGAFACSPDIVFDQAKQELQVLCNETMNIFSYSGAFISQYATGTPQDQEGESFAINELTNDTYIAAEHKIYVIDASGKLVSTPWTGAETVAGTFSSGNDYMSLTVDRTTGYVYVASFAGENILTVLNEFGSSSSEQDLGQIDSSGPEERQIGKIIELNAVAVAPATDDLYVSEWNLLGVSTVRVYGPDVVYAAEIFSQSISGAHLHSATLNARVDVGRGVSNSYHFEYGPTTAYGSVTPSVSAEGEISATAQVEGLQPETTYHFRIVATNVNGTSYGPDTTFATQANQIGLPDGRGFEMVSPVDNANGNVYYPASGFEVGFGPEDSLLPMRASTDGDAVEYVADPQATGGVGSVGTASGEEYVATRASSGGWSAVDLETPGLDKAPFDALLPSELSNSGTSDVPAGSHILSGGGDSVDGRLSPIGVLPEGKIAADFELGGGGLSHVISADGSRVFWTDTEAGPNEDQIFVRENNDRTVAVSMGAAQYWTATPDGRYAFYTEGGSLWRFDVDGETRENLSGDNAGVQEVIGVNETGEDGAYVYFVATGELTGNANSRGDKAVLGESNVYLDRDGSIVFIAANAGTEGPTRQVASDGHSVVFQSTASLTGYDNKLTAFPFIVREVFVYDADTAGLSCVSCNPTGALPTADGGSLQETYSDSFTHRWISKDGGRVFFDSTEGLVAQDTNGVQDVYEWEREGEGSCAPIVPARPTGGCIYLLSGGASSAKSYLLDASASGDDVFIISRAKLTSQDAGETYEVYDARVGATQPPAEPACTGTGCQGLPSAPPPFATPSSVTFSGVGNFPPAPPVVVGAKAKAKPVRCGQGLVKRKGKCRRKPAVGRRAGKSTTHGKGSR